MSCSDLPDEVIVLMFGFTDGAIYNIMTRVCKKWNQLGLTVAVWEKIVRSYKEKISNTAWTMLPHDYEIDRFIEAYPKGVNTRVQSLILTYRILATCLIVVPGHTDTVSIDSIRRMIKKGTQHHTRIRRTRVFGTLSHALRHAKKGDFFFLNEGVYDEQVTINTPIHICGRVEQRVEPDNTIGHVLDSKFRKPIIFDTPRQHSTLLCLHMTHHAKLDIRNHSILSLHSLVLTGESYITLGLKCELEMSRCGLEKTSKSVCIDVNFNRLDMRDCFLTQNNFQPEDLLKLMNKFTRNTSKPAQGSRLKRQANVIRGLAYTFSVISRVKSPKLRECFDREGVADKLYKAMAKFNHDPKVILAILHAIIRMLLVDEPSMMKSLDKNIIPSLMNLSYQHQDNYELQQWIVICMRNYLEKPKCINYFKDETLYERLLDQLERYKHEPEVVFETISFFWHSCHLIIPVRQLIINALPRFVKIVDCHPTDTKIIKEMLGLIWNLSGTWPAGITQHVLPLALSSFKLLDLSDYATAHVVIGAILVIGRRATVEELDIMIDNNIVMTLLELKSQHLPADSEAIFRFWKSLAILALSMKAQRLLIEFIRSDQKYPPLSILDKVKIARAITIHPKIDSRLYELIHFIISTSRREEPDVFFIAMDAVVHLIQNDSLVDEKPKFLEMGKFLLERATQFTDKRVQNWVGWARTNILGTQQIKYNFGFSRQFSTEYIHITHDGTTMRHDFSGMFGTAIVTHPVFHGKWYFEAEILTLGLFFIGWVDDEFRPEPNQGIGVGSDSHSWAIDLKKQVIRHTYFEGAIKQPYGKDCSVEVGCVIQCYLDMDKLEMSFGFNGKHLGVAFSKFHATGGLRAALSTNLENECRFIFEAEKFKYSPGSYTPLCNAINPPPNLPAPLPNWLYKSTENKRS